MPKINKKERKKKSAALELRREARPVRRRRSPRLCACVRAAPAVETVSGARTSEGRGRLVAGRVGNTHTPHRTAPFLTLAATTDNPGWAAVLASSRSRRRTAAAIIFSLARADCRGDARECVQRFLWPKSRVLRGAATVKASRIGTDDRRAR